MCFLKGSNELLELSFRVRMSIECFDFTRERGEVICTTMHVRKMTSFRVQFVNGSVGETTSNIQVDLRQHLGQCCVKNILKSP